VVLGEPPGQRLGQLRDLDAEPTLGQIGQHGRVTLPLDQGLQHQPTGHTADVGGHRGQFDAGILQQFLQPLDLPAAFAGHHRPGTGQVPQLTDRCRRDERAADQTVRAELGQPRGVGHVTLAAGQVLHLPGIDQHQLEPSVLEQVIERLPVITCRLHHHQTHLLGDQVLSQRQDGVRRRGPGPHRLHGLAAARPGDPDTHLRVPLGHIHPRAAAVDHLHDQLPSPAPIDSLLDAGRAKEIHKSDARAQGNNPRFSWRPSAPC
jgi:hypothetical protein